MKVILLSHTLDGASLCGQAAAVCTASHPEMSRFLDMRYGTLVEMP